MQHTERNEKLMQTVKDRILANELIVLYAPTINGSSNGFGTPHYDPKTEYSATHDPIALGEAYSLYYTAAADATQYRYR